MRVTAKWVGDGDVLPPDEDVLVLAVDEEDPSVPARRACWVRYWRADLRSPMYRSCDLSDLDFGDDDPAFTVI